MDFSKEDQSSNEPRKNVYLDYNATTPLDDEVLESITHALKSAWGNPSSSYQQGTDAKELVKEARCNVAEMIGAKPSDIVFTSGGTESNNVILHTAVKHFHASQMKSSNGIGYHGNGENGDVLPHFITTNLEHDAVKLVLEHFADEGIASVTFVPASPKTGCVSVDDVIAAVRPSTCMVSIMLANNETGVIQIRRSVMSARKALMASFVPQNLGFQHIDRDAVINDHTRPLAHELFANDGKSPAILVLDGTYIYMYIQKSGNFQFQRRSYSLHKNRPLVKPMMVVTTTGYIVAVLGPYLADSKNSDARILNHMLAANVHEIKEWVQEEDVFVVDRGFRDSAEFLEDLGITMEMPSFLKRGDKQLSTEESNNSRLVTKPVKEIFDKVAALNKTRRCEPRILLHTDAAQAIGKIDVNVQDLSTDYLTIVGHKFYGPRIGAIYCRDLGSKDVPLYPMFFGGGQERNYRPGTENTGMIAGLGKASELIVHNIDKYSQHLKLVRDYLEQKLQDTFHDRVHFNGKLQGSERLPNTCNVSFIGSGLEGHKILSKCKHLQASVGAACHSQNRASPILLAIGIPESIAKNAVRLSVGRETTLADIDLVVQDLKTTIGDLDTHVNGNV